MAGAGRLSTLEELQRRIAGALPESPLLVALSGGPDSAVLAWVAAVAGRGPARAVSVDHGSTDSPRLMAAAEAIAGRLGLPHSVIGVEPGGSEGVMRERRLQALEGACAPGEHIATAHTADDQAETVLTNLMRGAGVTGLSGIPPRRGAWVRPMLTEARSEVRMAAESLSLPFVDDPANDDPSHLRTRVRATVVPTLAAINPRIVEALVRTASLAGADDRMLEEEAARHPITRAHDEVRLPAAVLSTLPLPVATRVARRALRLVDGPYPGSNAAVSGVLRLAGGEGSHPVGAGWAATREGPWVTLHRAEIAPAAPTPLAIPGTTVFGRWRITARPGVAGPPTRSRAVVRSTGLAAATVRPAEPGDRIEIGHGSKKVSTALAEAGVPVRLRSGWPVVSVAGRILWVAGVRAAPTAEGDPVTMTLEEGRW